jgi:hypothetical protein
MSRLIFRLGGLTALAAMTAGHAQAQYVWPAGGATVQGDILRGEASLLSGWGSYNLNTAMAASLLADTWVRLNQYAYESLQEDGRQRALRIALKHQRLQETLERRNTRLTEHPELVDVYRGDALNALARAVGGMGLHPSAQRVTRVGVPGGTLQKTPLVLAGNRSVVSLARLDVRDGWPLLLREPGFDAARRAYEEALDRVMAEAFARNLSLPSVDVLKRTADDLMRAFQAAFPADDTADARHAHAFLDRLAGTSGMLRDPRCAEAVADVTDYRGTSVADLIGFMARHGLRFGPAETPAERELYETLYPLLAGHRQKLQATLARK